MQLPAFIGKYELLEFLGGGMSQVYRARDTVIDRPVVVKLLTNAGSSDPEAKARFLQEARVAGKIQHENIVSVFDFGEHEGRPFIVMEYLKGEDLRDAIRGGRTGGVWERLKIALQIAEALNYVHSSGVVHRDIKPENIHVDPSGRIKLMDFGIAKTADLSLTRTGMTMGTPYYMAPEQVSGRPVDTLVDVYAFGMLFFELLTGTRGVTGETMESVFYQILSVPLDVTAMENAGAPPAVRDLVMRCTAKSASERPQGFPPIIEALRAILSDAEGDRPQTVPAPPQPPRKEISPAGPMWRLSLVTYGLVLLVTLIAIGAWWWLKPPESIPGMLYIPAGTFLSGEDKHPVTLKPFYIDETEVTNAEFARYCGASGKETQCQAPTGDPGLPVVNVSYAQARAYAKSFGKRLPSPLEWERAARGTQGDPFPWGSADDPRLANVLNNPSLGEPRGLMPARSFLPHQGVYQMVGNAWEMVEGEVKPSAEAVAYYASLLKPPPTAEESWITIRGGSFNFRLTPGIIYDSSSIPESYTAKDIGFRCVKDP
jgi:eukaryotic-like serine/threonine-protein kinase